ncbi:hypothetical protein LHYA1_G002713 [Lachnellula hyalina]|uniref:AGA1 A-agglutinin anchor subunit n=1 Tax=Lachnellula hyalina TaxID=1316788 RepID=A0A8H8R719_9HELO|nr:uncharacterized protein LHYA1_G002713 [Lachnellula hyalina]TVY29191.1 hypothetical protein LHYA1_G002713 [Lachnellula hyalina]
MSTLPSRTRSLRKPAENGSRPGRSTTADPKENNIILKPAPTTRSSQSPSRLPTVNRPTRSTSTVTRPPNSSASIPSKPSIRPPSTRAGVSKPVTTELQRRPSTSGRNGNPASHTTEPVKQDRSRPPVTQFRHVRNSSTSNTLPSNTTRPKGHTRNKSSSTLSSTLNTSTALEPAPRLEPPQLRKPNFSTLQQHFSPAKNLAPKPHPAAFLAPPSPSKLPSNIAISAETAKLQNELLQLHLLHKDVGLVDSQWRASAKKKLGERFQEVVDRNDVLVQEEVDAIGKVNAAALRKWKEAGTPGWGLDERVQVLDEVISGVWNLGDSGGKYSRVVRRFERWLSRSQGTIAARENDADADIIFVEEIEGAWKDDCLILGKKLEVWREQLRGLETPDKGSSLAVVVDGCRRLVKGMLMELSVMAQIERDSMIREGEWIQSMNDDVDDEKNDMPVAGACWRSR